MDPPKLMLAPLSMTDAEYQLWRSSIPYADQLMDDLDHAEFSKNHLMPSLSAGVCILSFSLSFLFFCFSLRICYLRPKTFLFQEAFDFELMIATRL